MLLASHVPQVLNSIPCRILQLLYVIVRMRYSVVIRQFFLTFVLPNGILFDARNNFVLFHLYEYKI